MNTYEFPVNTREGISHIYIPCANSPCFPAPRESATRRYCRRLRPSLATPRERNPRVLPDSGSLAQTMPVRGHKETEVALGSSPAPAHTAPVSLLRSRARRTARLRYASRSACCAATPVVVGRTCINPPRRGVYAYGFSGPGCGTGGSGSVLACEGCASPPAVAPPSLGSRRQVGWLMPMSSQNSLSHPIQQLETLHGQAVREATLVFARPGARNAA